MHDNLVPEEGEQAYNQLLALLRSSSQKREPIEATEQAQIIARVRERLVQKDLEASLNGNLLVPQPGMLNSSLHQAESPAAKPRRDKRRLRLMALLAAAMIVALLLGTPLLLLRPRPRSTGGDHPAHNMPAGLPALTLSPNVTSIGSAIQLAFKNFTPSTRVALTLDRQIPIPIDGTSNIISVGPEGSAKVAARIESDWGMGFHLIMAEDLTTRYTASATLLVTGSAIHTYASFVATNGIMFGFDAQHVHFNPFEHMLNPTTVGGLTKQWAYNTVGSVFSSPAVAGGTLYVGSADGNVYAIDAASGTKKWAYQTGNTVGDDPAVVGGVVYVGSEDHTLYALNAASGAKKWAYQTRGEIVSSPAVVDGVVYVGSEDGTLYALNATSGTKKWAYHIGNWVDSSPAVAGGIVYVGSEDGNVYALNATSGTKKWAYHTGNFVYSSPAVVGGMVYVGSGDGNVYALDAASGTKNGPIRQEPTSKPRQQWWVAWSTSAPMTAPCTRSMPPPGRGSGPTGQVAPCSPHQKWRTVWSTSALAMAMCTPSMPPLGRRSGPIKQEVSTPRQQWSTAWSTSAVLTAPACTRFIFLVHDPRCFCFAGTA